ncbi:hypothetical protein DFP72DRAFT_990281 [Ephemerocybe angulata]|uniref:EKC/KEOPS complex subunit BUD32 n=1 Tax=Ephemerocybe angulata TaxID=980116 RepID=A0A8H6M6I4_9AGAR|nr:hypothetical protein DFP72DRAFT_990281 [Tulosesus angulatus]
MTSATLNLISSSKPISQGAEAAKSPPMLIKHRFKKKYRHESLDTTLTKARVAGEARLLLRCLKSGVNVPQILMVDASEGVLGIEWIEGQCVRKLLPGGEEPEEGREVFEEAEQSTLDASNPLRAYRITIDQLLGLIGTELAKLHKADIIHGDLTTSNMMVRHPSSFSPSKESGVPTELVLIDFGLSFVSTLVEDKAVDLYVLERAFASTHPDSEPMFASVLNAYAKVLTTKEWKAIKTRLDEVRMRGRKRSMVG